MNCPRCHQPTETGAVFCGNCGFQLAGTPPQAPQQSQPFATSVPAYATAPASLPHTGDTKALISLIAGIFGIGGAIIPIVGLVLGITGLVLGTLSRASHKKTLSMLGIIFSIIAILLSIAAWAYTIQHQKAEESRNKPSGSNSAAEASATISTPCYSVSFIQKMNTDHDQKDSCDVRAYEGTDIIASNDVYKVYGNEVAAINDANFNDVAKKAIEKDVSNTLSGFEIVSEGPSQFAGSPAYIAHAVNKKENIAVVEAAVLHKVDAGYNIFSLVHATKGSDTDLRVLETQWQWK
jgi:hypothetical protein